MPILLEQRALDNRLCMTKFLTLGRFRLASHAERFSGTGSVLVIPVDRPSIIEVSIERLTD